jgi:23S rRNA pseudouridine1911/1915/1917 synthase
MIHGDGRTDRSHLCQWIQKNYPETDGVGEPIQRDGKPDIPRPGIVHRLDKETSGVVIVVRNPKAYEHTKKQFKNRSIKKKYQTLVYGEITDPSFTIDEPIGRSSGDFRRRSVPPYVRGETKSAHTNFVTKQANKTASFLTAYPKTGRTHQIRVHLKSIHHPVVCDSLYADGKECFDELNRQALHARRITFNTPDGQTIAAETDLPPDFQSAKDAVFS